MPWPGFAAAAITTSVLPLPFPSRSPPYSRRSNWWSATYRRGRWSRTSRRSSRPWKSPGKLNPTTLDRLQPDAGIRCGDECARGLRLEHALGPDRRLRHDRGGRHHPLIEARPTVAPGGCDRRPERSGRGSALRSAETDRPGSRARPLQARESRPHPLHCDHDRSGHRRIYRPHLSRDPAFTRRIRSGGATNDSRQCKEFVQLTTALGNFTALVMLLTITAYSVAGGVDYGAGIWDLLAGRGPRAERARQLIDRAMA